MRHILLSIVPLFHLGDFDPVHPSKWDFSNPLFKVFYKIVIPNNVYDTYY